MGWLRGLPLFYLEGVVGSLHVVWFGLMLTCYQVAFFNVDACFFDIYFDLFSLFVLLFLISLISFDLF